MKRKVTLVCALFVMVALTATDCFADRTRVRFNGNHGGNVNFNLPNANFSVTNRNGLFGLRDRTTIRFNGNGFNHHNGNVGFRGNGHHGNNGFRGNGYNSVNFGVPVYYYAPPVQFVPAPQYMPSQSFQFRTFQSFGY